MGVIDQILGYADVCCGIATILILLIIGFVLFQFWKSVATKPPKRAETPWETKLWNDLRYVLEKFDMGAKLEILTDRNSPPYPQTYDCVGILNIANYISIILIREKGFPPKLEILVADPEIVSGGGSATDTVRLYANGLDTLGIFLYPVPRCDQMKDWPRYEQKYSDWFDMTINKKLNPILLSKGSEQAIAVLEIDPGRNRMINRLLDRGDKALFGEGKEE